MSDDQAQPNAEPGAAARPEAPRLSRSQRREKAASDSLRTLIRDLHMDRFGTVPPRERVVPLTLQLTARADQNWELQFDPPLAEQMLTQIEDAQAGLAVYQRGRVYCFRCDSSDCEHADPPNALSVFAGYEPTGAPEWRELAQMLIEARDERVDRVFGDRPEIVTRVQFGHNLRLRQLSSFGRSSKTYSLLGQVIAGYFLAPAPERKDRSAERLAITFQAVETRGLGGAVRLEINPVARVPEGAGELDELFVSGWEPWVHRAYTLAVRDVKSIERQVEAARSGSRPEEVRRAMAQVPAVLHRLSDWLDRGHRQTQRRTHHVEERRQGQRPVHKAMDDLSAAPAASMYFDEKTSAVIACGEQGRTHAFSTEGKHITSFVLKPAAVAFRLRTRRWRALTPEEAEQYRERVKERASPAETGEAGAGEGRAAAEDEKQ